MKKNIINLAIVSCFTFAAMSAYADSDKSMSNRSMSDRSMSVDSDSDNAGSDRTRNTNSSRSNRSQQSDNSSADKNRRSNRSGAETSGSYRTTASDQQDYYKNYKHGSTSDSHGPVDSAKDIQRSGKILNQDRLDVECKMPEGVDAGTEGRGQGCQPRGS